MGYIGSHLWQLRQFWGNKLLLYPGVGAIIQNPQGEILLGQRTDVHEWCHFGGGGEPLQSVEDTLKRELEEELGITPTTYQAFGFMSHPRLTRTIFPNKDDLHYWDLLFLVTSWQGELKVGDDEHSQIRFFKPTELPENLFKDTPPALAMLQKWRQTNQFQID